MEEKLARQASEATSAPARDENNLQLPASASWIVRRWSARTADVDVGRRARKWPMADVASLELCGRLLQLLFGQLQTNNSPRSSLNYYYYHFPKAAGRRPISGGGSSGIKMASSSSSKQHNNQRKVGTIRARAQTGVSQSRR